MNKNSTEIDQADTRTFFVRVVMVILAGFAVTPILSFWLGLLRGGAEPIWMGGANMMATLVALLIAPTVRHLAPQPRLFGKAYLAIGLTVAAYGVGVSILVPPNALVPIAGWLFVAIAFLCALSIAGAEARGFDIGRWMAAMLLVAAALCIEIPLVLAAMDRAVSEPVAWHLAIPGFINVRTLGLPLSVGAAAGLGLIIAGVRSRSAMLALATLTVIAVALLAWSGTRSGVVGAVAGLIAALVVGRNATPFRLALAGVTLLAGLAASTAFHTPTNSFGVVNRLISNVGAIAESAESGDIATEIETAGSGRVRLWAWFADQIAERPLLGHGYLTAAQYHDGSYEKNAHNLVLELAFGMGVPFTIVVCLWLAAVTGAALLRAVRIADPVLAPAASVVVCVAVDGMMSSALSTPYSLYAFAMALGALIGGARHAATTATSESPLD